MSNPQQPPSYDVSNNQFNPEFFAQPYDSNVELLAYIEATYLEKIGTPISNAMDTTFAGEIISNFNILSNNQVLTNTFQLTGDGQIEFSDNTIQTTAYTGQGIDSDITNTTTNASYNFPIITNSATGIYPLFVSSGLTINPSTNITTGTFSGNLTGNSSSSDTILMGLAVTGTYQLAMCNSTPGYTNIYAAISNPNPLTYNFSNFTLSSTNFAGTLNGNCLGSAAGANTLLISGNSSNTNYPIPFKTTSSPYAAIETDVSSRLTYNTSTSILTVPTIVSNLTGAATKIAVTQDNTDAFYYIPFVKTNTASNFLYVDVAAPLLSYNPSSVTLATNYLNLITHIYFTNSVKNIVFNTSSNIIPFTTGSYNFVAGDFCGYQLTSGGANVLIGRNCGNFLTTGAGNIAIGTSALSGNNTNNNVAIGTQSCINMVVGSNNNTAIGNRSGYNGTSSNATFCTFIGNNTGTNSAVNLYNKSSCLGNLSIITKSNQIVLGTITEETDILGSLVVAGNTTLSTIKYSASTQLLQVAAPSTSLNFTLGTLIMDANSTNIQYLIPSQNVANNGLSFTIQKTGSTLHTVQLIPGIGNTMISDLNVSEATYTIITNTYQRSFRFYFPAWYPY